MKVHGQNIAEAVGYRNLTEESGQREEYGVLRDYSSKKQVTKKDTNEKS